MPNWIFNKLIVTGPNIPALLKEIGTPDRLFSFKRVIPMPEAISIIHGNHADIAIAAAMSESPEKYEQISAIVQSFFSKFPHAWLELLDLLVALGDEKKELSLLEKIQWRLDKGLALSEIYSHVPADKNHPVTFAELAGIGNHFLENIANYQALGWYDWSIQNWGTKWDLDDSTKVLLQEENNLILNFDTAWDPPLDIIVAMGTRFPEYKFRLTWHGPETGIQGRFDVFAQTVRFKKYKFFSEDRLVSDLDNIKIPACLKWKNEHA